MSSSLFDWDVPPIEKIHEAFSAVIDGRVKLFDGYAKVSSSDYKKEYTVEWEEDTYSSNDNASYWQGYLGYPVIAVLMLQGKLSCNREVAEHFKSINWKELNTQYKNKYSKVVAIILEDLKNKDVDTDAINNEINKIYSEIKQLKLHYKRSKMLPPK